MRITLGRLEIELIRHTDDMFVSEFAMRLLSKQQPFCEKCTSHHKCTFDCQKRHLCARCNDDIVNAAGDICDTCEDD